MIRLVMWLVAISLVGNADAYVGKRRIAAPNDTAYVDTGQVFLMAAGTHAVFSAGSTAQFAHAIIDTMSNAGTVLVRNAGSLTAAFTGGNSCGIGVATPQNKLDVEGNVAIGATYSGMNNAPANGLIVEGNVGIGSVPLAASSGFTSLFFGGNSTLLTQTATGASGEIYIAQNGYLNAPASSFIYRSTAVASAYIQTAGSHKFTTVASGTAGDALSWGTPKLMIGNTGYVGIGTTTADHALEIVAGANCSEIDPSETSWTNCSSREEWKEDIAEVDTAAVVEAIRTLRPKKYTYTEPYVRSKYQQRIDAIALDSTLTDSVWQIKNAAIEARIAVEEKAPHVGFMAGDVYPLAYALEPAKADSTGYSLDPIVQGQQVLILNLLRRVEALEARVTVLEKQ